MSTLRRSWDDGSCPNGDSCWWASPTTSNRETRRNSDRSHLLMRHLLFSLGGPGGTSVAPVGLGRDHRLGNELPAVELVDVCLTISIDLALLVVVDTRGFLHAIIRGVVCTSKLVVDLKLRRGMLPLLVVIVEHAFALIVGNIDALQRVKHGCHNLLCDFICIGTLVDLEQMSKLAHGSILVTDDLVKAFDVTFLMVRHLVGVDLLLYEPESPDLVTEWIVPDE